MHVIRKKWLKLTYFLWFTHFTVSGGISWITSHLLLWYSNLLESRAVCIFLNCCHMLSSQVITCSHSGPLESTESSVHYMRLLVYSLKSISILNHITHMSVCVFSFVIFFVYNTGAYKLKFMCILVRETFVRPLMTLQIRSEGGVVDKPVSVITQSFLFGALLLRLFELGWQQILSTSN